MKILVAMSGGLDSSTAALLLKQQGHEISGVTLRMYADESRCCNASDIEDARNVAAFLGIPHHILDFRREFSETVVSYFLNSYLQGETPNPCVICNHEIKLGLLKKFALHHGFSAIATGHYARKDFFSDHLLLKKACDRKKSQEYFLCRITDSLDFYQFPLGDYTKEKIREIADSHHLCVSDKKDSQDICFLPKNTEISAVFPDTFKNWVWQIILPDGRKAGEISGGFFTIGQRKGLNLSLPEPHYISKINAEKKLLFITPADKLYCSHFFLRDFESYLKNLPDQLNIKIRSQAQEISCRIKTSGNQAEVFTAEPVRAVTPGQTACIYHEDFLVASGTITVNPESVV